MFYHKVLSDTDDLVDGLIVGSESHTAAVQMRERLLRSQRFHIGELFDGIGLVNPENVPFNIDYTKIKMPYEVTYIDCYANIDFLPEVPREQRYNRLAVMVVHEKKMTSVECFHFFPERKAWFHDSTALMVSLKTGRSLMVDLIKSVELNREETDMMFLENQANYSMPYILHTLLSCKNIESEDIHPPSKVNAKRRKKGKKPLYSYKVLNMTRSKGKTDLSKPHQGGSNRVHLCRGHFKTYTEDNPLFGNLTGTYWWQPQARGNKKRGVAMKRYDASKIGRKNGPSRESETDARR